MQRAHEARDRGAWARGVGRETQTNTGRFSSLVDFDHTGMNDKVNLGRVLLAQLSALFGPVLPRALASGRGAQTYTLCMILHLAGVSRGAQGEDGPSPRKVGGQQVSEQTDHSVCGATPAWDLTARCHI